MSITSNPIPDSATGIPTLFLRNLGFEVERVVQTCLQTRDDGSAAGLSATWTAEISLRDVYRTPNTDPRTFATVPGTPPTKEQCAWIASDRLPPVNTQPTDVVLSDDDIARIAAAVDDKTNCELLKALSAVIGKAGCPGSSVERYGLVPALEAIVGRVALCSGTAQPASGWHRVQEARWRVHEAALALMGTLRGTGTGGEHA